MKKSVLLIGGAGYIGPVVARDLLCQGYDVTCFDNLIYGNTTGVLALVDQKKYKFISGDLCNKKDLDRALVGITDVVILGGLVGDPITKKFPNESNLINEIGIQNCIKSLNGKELNQVILISTCSNYGIIPYNELANEETKLTPLSLYAKSKVNAENLLLNQNSGIDYTPTVLRFATAFGVAPRMRFDLTVNEFVSELYSKRELIVFDPDTWRPYCHVSDFARMISQVLISPKEKVYLNIFNVGSEENNYTKRQLINLIQQKLPKPNVRYLDNGTDPRNYMVDFTKSKEVLGFEAKTSIWQGIEEIVETLDQGLFADRHENANYYGNFHLKYAQNEK
jgi:nucleoside-diphosphate-sugar epimerase